MKYELQRKDIENDRLLAEQLQINEDNSDKLAPIDSGIIDGVSDVSSESSFIYPITEWGDDNESIFIYPQKDP